jgi:two-component system, sensor histidine kinase and response regulator
METMKVLVVDDEPGIRTGVIRVLRGFTMLVPEIGKQVQFDIAQAESAEQALETIQSNTPHILLLDNKLPGISGLELLERIVDMNLDMLTIMITAYASIETAVRATKQGAYDFLPKPFTPAELKNTVRKAAEHRVVAMHAKELAAEKRKVRFQFISVLGHELKAPINAIDGYMHILRDGTAANDPKMTEQIVQRCLVRTEYMRKMIADLLDLTRIESGEKKREMVEIDLAAEAKNAIETMTPDASKRGISFELHHEGPVTLVADRAEMNIVLNNLVSNAVKYNKDGGRVAIALKREADHVEVRVADTGIGMSKEESARLFNEFVRIKNARTKDILGSGLGLSILKKIAALYSGDISVDSTPDVGTTFTITLTDAAPVKD